MAFLLNRWWPIAHHLLTSVSLDSFWQKKGMVTGFSLSVGDNWQLKRPCWNVSHIMSLILKNLQRLPMSLWVKLQSWQWPTRKTLQDLLPHPSLWPLALLGTPVAMLVSLLFLKQAGLMPASGPLQMLFLLLGVLSPQMLAWPSS